MSEKSNYFGSTCVCLARVSTSKQDYDAQINALHKEAANCGYTVLKDIATKESGFRSFDKKEGFNELIDFLNNNNCRIVMCTELSRLSRKQSLLGLIKDWSIDHKIQLIVIDIKFKLFDEDTLQTNLSQDLVFSIFSTFAANEMREKFARLKRGRAELVKDGYSISGKTCFGYDRVRTSEKIKGKYRYQMVVNEKQAKQIRTIYDWYLYGIDGDITKCSTTKIKDECIARGFDRYLHSKRNVNKALKYKQYTGELVTTNNRRKNPEYWDYGDKSKPKYVYSSSEIKMPMIIDKKTFDAVQKKMGNSCTLKKADATSPTGFADKSRKHFTLLSKLVVCPVCDNFFLGEYRIKKNERGISTNYRCLNHKPHGVSALSMRYLDFSAWSFCILQQTKYKDYLQSMPKSFNTTEIEKRIDNLNKRKELLRDDLVTLSKRYLDVKSVVEDEEITRKYNADSKRLKKEIADCDILIQKEQENLNFQKRAIERAWETGEFISKLSDNKIEMRKYIQHILKAIIPVYHDADYYVLKLVLRSDSYQYFSIDPKEYNSNGLPYSNYIIIYKRDNLRPKFRLISANCKFDVSTKKFLLPDHASGTLETVFQDEEEVYFKSIEYKQLNIYDDDAPSGKTLIKLIRPYPVTATKKVDDKEHKNESTNLSA